MNLELNAQETQALKILLDLALRAYGYVSPSGIPVCKNGLALMQKIEAAEQSEHSEAAKKAQKKAARSAAPLKVVPKSNGAEAPSTAAQPA